MSTTSSRRMLVAAAIGSALTVAPMASSAQPVAQTSGAVSAPANRAVETEIMRLEMARIDALVKRDFPALERYMATDSIHIESSGKLTTFAEFMESYRADTGTFTTFAIDKSEVRLNGDIAVVTGTYHNRIRTGGKLRPTKIARFTRVWVRRDGEWKMWSHQATAVPSGS